MKGVPEPPCPSPQLVETSPGDPYTVFYTGSQRCMQDGKIVNTTQSTYMIKSDTPSSYPILCIKYLHSPTETLRVIRQASTGQTKSWKCQLEALRAPRMLLLSCLGQAPLEKRENKGLVALDTTCFGSIIRFFFKCHELQNGHGLEMQRF